MVSVRASAEMATEGSQSGGWAGSPDLGRLVPSLRAANSDPEPLWVALRPQPRVSPDCTVITGRVIGTVVTLDSGVSAREEL